MEIGREITEQTENNGTDGKSPGKVPEFPSVP